MNFSFHLATIQTKNENITRKTNKEIYKKNGKEREVKND
jgi:hypothetical protein